MDGQMAWVIVDADLDVEANENMLLFNRESL